MLTINHHRNQRGFSLIELAVVLIVIGVIAAIAIPTFTGVVQRATERAEVETVRVVMADAVAIAAVNGRSLPNADDIETALSETTASATASGGVQAAATSQPFAVLVGSDADSTAPETVRRLYLGTDSDAVSLSGDSSSRAGACVVAVAVGRNTTGKLVTPAEFGEADCGTELGAAVADAQVAAGTPTTTTTPPADPMIAPDGTDCRDLILPTVKAPPATSGPLYVSAEGIWTAGSVSGCVPVTFDYSFGSTMVCPPFYDGDKFYWGIADQSTPSSPWWVSDTAAAAGTGCVPGQEMVEYETTGWPAISYCQWGMGPLGAGDVHGEPYVRYDWWLAGERCVWN